MGDRRRDGGYLHEAGSEVELGRGEWLRFFSLMSSWLAMEEGTNLVPGTPEDPVALPRELRRLAKGLNVIERLTAYGSALQLVEDVEGKMRGHTFLLDLDIQRQQLFVRRFDDIQLANEAYAETEVQIAATALGMPSSSR